MHITLLTFTISLLIGVGTAQAQTRPPKWEASGSVGLLQARPADASTQSHDDWYGEVRYALGAGRYWTEHLKTEVEFAAGPEGSTYEFLHANSFESLHRLDQLSARMVWQF